ncbi:hypothetical protein [Neotamlana laminarinivorans]|uniref:Uncharacterized protein n=1 Tax=Neotamlana laminarinivorans TaxID=2883124 RepID=A0A9X1HZ70_9FLAO|nr:hypothetical protein [Tamlana laminarinivorans]MCB4798565.1 hypothetical protein [Tamlana laminarinivorans]
MKHCFYILILFSFSVFAQNINSKIIKQTPFDADSIFGIDNFGTIFFSKDNVFYKKSKDNILSYNNIQLGDLQSANSFNPLKINLFYKDFNTVIILDNRLAEIYKIDFNNIHPYKMVSYASMGFDNSIWIFNQELQKLELFNYKTNTTKAQTAPVTGEILDLKSNYNYCWLLTKHYLYVYTYFGSLVKKIKNQGYTAMAINNESVILKTKNGLFYLKENSNNPTPITTPNLNIKQFFVTNETLYIYTLNSLQEFQLKI